MIQMMGFNPKRLNYDRDGVPYLKVTEVEAIAYEVLAKYSSHVLTTPCISPVAEILKGLHQNTGLQIGWEDLGYKGTAKILGKVSFSRQTLFLDVSAYRTRPARTAARLRRSTARDVGLLTGIEMARSVPLPGTAARVPIKQIEDCRLPIAD